MMEIKHNFSWICIWVSEWVEFNAPLDTIWKMISSDKSLLAGESADQGTWSSAVVLISVSEAPAVDNSLSQSTSPYSVPRYRLSTFGRRTFPSLVLLHGTLYQIVSIIQHWVLTVLETTENRNGIIWDLLKPHAIWLTKANLRKRGHLRLLPQLLNPTAANSWRPIINVTIKLPPNRIFVYIYLSFFLYVSRKHKNNVAITYSGQESGHHDSTEHCLKYINTKC